MPSSAPDGASDRFAYQGNVIRLTQADFDRWRRSFPHVGDLRDELDAIDGKAREWTAAERKRWFQKTSGWLAARNRERKAEKFPPDLYPEAWKGDPERSRVEPSMDERIAEHERALKRMGVDW